MKLRKTTGLLMFAALALGCVHNRVRTADAGEDDAGVFIEAGVEGSGPSRVNGETKVLFGTQVTNYVDLDANGVVTAFSWTMPLATVSGVPETTTADFVAAVGVPEALTKQTVVLGLDYSFLPKGHAPPGVYDIPHWEWHIFGMPEPVFETIDCSNENVPSQDDLPSNYVYLPYPFVLVCVPRQGGVHVYDQTAPEFNRERFTKAFALTVYAGQFASIEPKVSRDVLLARKSFSMPAPVMKTLRRSTPTLYPSKLDAVYDQASDAYTFTLSAFKSVQ